MSEQFTPKDYPFPVSCNELGQREQRSLLFHLLYAADALDYSASLESIAENISREYGFVILSTDTIFTTASAVIAQRVDLEKEIEPLLANWRFDRLSVATKLIVRYAIWEMLHTETAPSIVINEAVELAKCFAENNAYRFINGVLDEWAKRKGLVVAPTTPPITPQEAA
jgi:transcription antitermination protein NusB